ncbi:MAG: alpha/beta hydrolase [Desulfobacca sp.]|uniref:alpha/beta hydrolase n=1 Tax=Desulfobacca sp. TaxID=2067990 RepID=UPI00404B0C00
MQAGKQCFPGRLALCLLMVLASTLSALPAAARLETANFFSPALVGNLLDDPAQREVTIYLPPQYDAEPSRRFPVIYLLHGFKAKNHHWTKPAGPGQGLQLQELADALIAEGRISPLIIVMPDGSNAYGGSFYLNSPVTGHWEDYISRDLVAYVDRTYRTIPQAAARGVAGHSMGGYGAFLLGLRHPEVFGAIYALSPACLVFAEHFLKLQWDSMVRVADLTAREQFPALDWRQQVIIAIGAAVAPNPTNPPWLFDLPLQSKDGRRELAAAVWQRWLQSDPHSLVEPYRQNLARLRLAFDMGTADPLLPQSRQMHATLARLGIPHYYEEYDGDHVNRLRERLKEKVLPFFASYFEQTGEKSQ